MFIDTPYKLPGNEHEIIELEKANKAHYYETPISHVFYFPWDSKNKRFDTSIYQNREF